MYLTDPMMTPSAHDGPQWHINANSLLDNHRPLHHCEYAEGLSMLMQACQRKRSGQTLPDSWPHSSYCESHLG